MADFVPTGFVSRMVDAGESKIVLPARDTVQTGDPIIGSILFPVGLCMRYLSGFDGLSGVFMPTPLARSDERPGVTLPGVPHKGVLVCAGNLVGRLRALGAATIDTTPSRAAG